ncbi:hypothetical protein LIER_30429 [Lithospermum erythrorhizon]|uniref:Integrase catalytic domain-containing protein n=1 Tax=Lithospermum erythrorhizon TaxID=34254 RepID=A0AAV3RSU5_LITER
MASWPFDTWGLDMVGPMPKSAEGHVYILAAIDYFSKWAEVVPLLSGKKEEPNGLAEPFNKTLCNILKKVVIKSKKKWHEKMEEALWAYRTTYRTPTQLTPYALVYGVKVVLPLEVQISSLRVAVNEEITQ